MVFAVIFVVVIALSIKIFVHNVTLQIKDDKFIIKSFNIGSLNRINIWEEKSAEYVLMLKRNLSISTTVLKYTFAENHLPKSFTKKFPPDGTNTFGIMSGKVYYVEIDYTYDGPVPSAGSVVYKIIKNKNIWGCFVIKNYMTGPEWPISPVE